MAERKRRTRKAPKTPPADSIGGDEPRPGGRPPGSMNRHYDYANVHPSKCIRCGSPERSNYRYRRAEPLGLNHPLRDEQYTHIVYRSCACKHCGQWRWDKTPEKLPGIGKQAGPAEAE